MSSKDHNSYLQAELEWKKRKHERYRMYRQISPKLAEAMNKKGMTQADVKRTCEKNGYPIAQSAVSRIISYPAEDNEKEYSITLGDFLQVCKAININPSIVLDSASTIDIDSIQQNKHSPTFTRTPLVFDPTEDDFLGYCNKYHCYFYSTISSEAKLLHGELTLQASPLGDYCEAKFKLDTDKINKKQDKIFKTYQGKLAISPRMSSCYCLLENKKIGELCFIVFRHLYLNNEDLRCRLAVVATASAGDNRRPTIHRMLISKKIISEEQLEILKAQLLLNTSDIIISRASFEKLMEQNGRDFPPQIAQLFDATIQREEYYKFSEFQIRNINIPLQDKLRAICMLRNESISPKYNKVGSKADELIFDILSEDIK